MTEDEGRKGISSELQKLQQHPFHQARSAVDPDGGSDCRAEFDYARHSGEHLIYFSAVSYALPPSAPPPSFARFVVRWQFARGTRATWRGHGEN